MPNALMEAIYFRIPVIGSNIPGIKFFIKNYFNGLLFINNNKDSLTHCINFLIKNKRKREKFSRNAYNNLKKVSNPILFCQSWKKLLDE